MPTKKKNRPPRQQLIEAGKWAHDRLVEKGILAKHSIVDQILNDKDAPPLPGRIAYLPHRWTIQASQRMMFDILVIWMDKCKGDGTGKAESMTEFFTFLIGELRRQEAEFNKEIVNMPRFLRRHPNTPLLKDVFSPMQKKETVKSMQRFFVDSFAVALMLKDIHTTSAYLNWFLDWSQQLYLLWVKPDERAKIKIT